MNKFGGVFLKTKRLTLLAMLFALAIVLAILEGMLPNPFPVPGVKLGLSNIVVMFALCHMRKADAAVIAFLKSAFVLLTRGAVAGTLSLCGGLLSVAAMSVLLSAFGGGATYLSLSVAGAVAHNIGQIAAASAILKTPLWFYLPVLIAAGIITGAVTSVILKMSYPVLSKLHHKQIK